MVIIEELNYSSKKRLLLYNRKMGVDISHIIRHNFKDVTNHSSAMDYVKETISKLKENLFIYGVDEEFAINEDDCGLITFQLPIYDVEFELHNGFWDIESYYHYCQIVMHNGDYFWLRRKTFDIVRALGQNEAWYAEEYYTWNGGNIEEPETSFEEWLEFVNKKYGAIPEFDQGEIMKQENVYIPNYEPVYHDTFRECKETFADVQSKLKGYRLLGIEYVGNGYYRCEREGGLYLINSGTLMPMFREPIEAMLNTLNGPEFVIKKDGLSAVFDMDGKQLTDYVQGVFDWKWSEVDLNCISPCQKRIIYNEEAGIELPPR